MSPGPPPLIFITGFMGCGKSTLGRELARLMHRDFTDTDELVERMSGKQVSEIFADDGEAAFRKLETQALKHIAGQWGNHVVALGGGTICNQENLELVRRSGLLVYIQLPVPVLVERLAAASARRPLLQDLQGKSLEETVGERLEERKVYYEQAHLIVNGIGLDATNLHHLILTARPQKHN